MIVASAEVAGRLPGGVTGFIAAGTTTGNASYGSSTRLGGGRSGKWMGMGLEFGAGDGTPVGTGWRSSPQVQADFTCRVAGAPGAGIAFPFADSSRTWGEARAALRLDNGTIAFSAAYRDDRALAGFTMRFRALVSGKGGLGSGTEPDLGRCVCRRGPLGTAPGSPILHRRSGIARIDP